ncbi:MAG: hypothetical protein MUE41_16005, partial [Gemmatimonadaceae bacterium]|nr:hypothetical protein [Gemmatimonadaceae bacterium]
QSGFTQAMQQGPGPQASGPTFGATGGRQQPLFDIRVVWREKNSAIGLDGEHPITDFEVQPIRHVLGDRCADRPADLSQCELSNHTASVALECYKE